MVAVPPPYTLDVRARAAGRVIAGECCVDVAKDVGRSATSVRKRAGAYGREGIGGLMNMGDGIRVPAVDDGVFSQVGVSFLVRYFFFGFGRGACRPVVGYWFCGLPNSMFVVKMMLLLSYELVMIR